MAKGVYFVADVHLGLSVKDPAERERRFVDFLKTLSGENASALWLLGDIWDFWYEYRDVVPREGVRVVAQFIRLVDEGVEVCFVPGNHDIWCYSYFESLGMRKVRQPIFLELSGTRFCVGHGDGLGGSKRSYRVLQWIFNNGVLQKMFSSLHPRMAFGFGLGWSNSNRRKHTPYQFKGEDEPLYKYALQHSSEADVFLFGHFHVSVDMAVGGSRLVVLKDWMDGGTPHAVFDGEKLTVISS